MEINRSLTNFSFGKHLHKNWPSVEKRFFLELGLVVLVEEENFVRWRWEQQLGKLGIPIKTYSTTDAFIGDLQHFSERTIFFLDQDMYKTRGEGLILAKIIRANPRTQYSFISLVTNYARSDFLQEITSGLIDNSLDKFPRFIGEPVCSDYKEFSNSGGRVNFAGEDFDAAGVRESNLTSISGFL